MAEESVLATRVRAARIARHLTQTELGEKIGVHWMTVSQWERGSRTPTLHSITQLSEALMVPIEWFLGKGEE